MRINFLEARRFFRNHSGGDIAVFLSFLGLGITFGFAIHDATYSEAHTTSGLLILLGRFSGLLGTYLVLISLIVIARVPWIEKSVGFDRLVLLHRKLGPISFTLITIHVVAISLGYSLADSKGLMTEIASIITTYSWMYAALTAYLLFVVIALSSANRIRRSLRYESWWKMHLISYLAVALSLMHQLLTGSLFIFNETARIWWMMLYGYAAFTLVLWRFLVPIVRSFKHKLHVDHVVIEGNSAVSIYIRGRNLKGMHARGGSFFEWRFLSKSLWGQAHPYSLSAAPTDDMLRITVKNLGDHSSALAYLKVGTRVVAEGPYGVFNAKRSYGKRVVLIAGGVGVAPIRAVLEDFTSDTEIDLIYRVVTEEELILKKEIESLVLGKDARIHYLIGDPTKFSMSSQELLKLVPHMAEADVYLCGPPGLARIVRHSVEAIGVPSNKFHHEVFCFGPN
jgi:predicted ferric reductase